MRVLENLAPGRYTVVLEPAEIEAEAERILASSGVPTDAASRSEAEAQLALLQRALDQVQQLVGVEGLDDVVEGAGLQRAHGGVHRGVGGHDDDGQVRAHLGQARLQLQAVHLGHLDVHQRDVVGVLGRQAQRGRGAVGHVHAPAVLAEPAAEGLAHDLLVVHDQQGRGRCGLAVLAHVATSAGAGAAGWLSAGCRRGRRMVNVVPSPGRERTSMRAWCRWTMP